MNNKLQYKKKRYFERHIVSHNIPQPKVNNNLNQIKNISFNFKLKFNL